MTIQAYLYLVVSIALKLVINVSAQCSFPSDLPNAVDGSTPAPFQITVSKHEYLAGLAIQVEIKPSDTEPYVPLTGFYIQTKLVSSNGDPVGNFFIVNNSEYIGVTCPTSDFDEYGYPIIQSARIDVMLNLPITLNWMSHYSIGEVYFVATLIHHNVIEDNYSVWKSVTSQVILPIIRDVFNCTQYDCGDTFCRSSALSCPQRCPNGEFQCGIGCIPQNLTCNLQYDCPNGYDEGGDVCGYECASLYRACPNHMESMGPRCVRGTLFCNNQNDCEDWSDELNCGAGCGGERTGPSGSITAPEEFGTGLYRSNVRCIWTIQVRYGYRIRLIFVDFQIEDCVCCDIVTIYDGIDGTANKIEEICKDVAFASFVSTSNVMSVFTKTDGSITRNVWTGRYYEFGAGDDCNLPHLCSNGDCVRNGTTYQCICHAGYKPVDLNLNIDCIDVDECAAVGSSNPCENGVCTNSKGSFTCNCFYRFEKADDGTCIEVCNRFQKRCPGRKVCVRLDYLCAGEVCPPSRHLCDYNTVCLDQSKLCDGIHDCYDDHSDESECQVPCETPKKFCTNIPDLICVEEYGLCAGEVCPPEYHSCDDDRTCLRPSLKCDYIEQCEDGSDERNCYSDCAVTYRESDFCDPETCFSCTSDLSCIRIAYKCDGDYDCPDATDEADCVSVVGIIIATVIPVVVVVTVCTVAILCTAAARRKSRQGAQRRSAQSSVNQNTTVPVNVTTNPVMSAPQYQPDFQVNSRTYLAGNYAPGAYTYQPSPRNMHTSQRSGNGQTPSAPSQLPPPTYNEFISHDGDFERPAETNPDIQEEPPPPPSYDSLPDDLKNPSAPPVYELAQDMPAHIEVPLQDPANDPSLSPAHNDSRTNHTFHTTGFAREDGGERRDGNSETYV